jgi:hypothetical protein
MTQINPTTTQPAGNIPSPDDDPLLHLHKMSTTAGLGTQEYAEVNVTSVVAVIFGLASLLAMANAVLMVIPIVGVILGFIGLRQVQKSNGTQTGKGLAVTGLLLSGVITAVIFCYQGVKEYHTRADQQAIAALCRKYGDLVAQNKFDEAYNLFDDEFKSRVSQQAFTVHLTNIQNQGTLIPPMSGFDWNGLAQFQSMDDGTEMADSFMIVHYKGSDFQGRMSARFRRTAGGVWLFNDIPDQFPPLKSEKPQQ